MTLNASSTYYHIGPCNYIAAQNAIFQIASVFFLVAIIAPSTWIHGRLWLRIVLVVSNVLFACWGWLVLCAVDIFVWNFVFMIVNIAQAAWYFYSVRPVTLSSDLEMVYETQFKKVGLSRLEFKKLADISKISQELSTDSDYFVEGVTNCDSLSFLVWGRLKVSMQGIDLHKIYGENFIDSPEYLLYETSEKSQVTVTADMPSLFVSWDKMEIIELLNTNYKLRLAFEAVIAKDVAKKVMDTSYRMAKVYSLDSFPDLRTPNIESTVGSNDERTVVQIDMKPKLCGIKRSQSAGGNKKPLHGILRNKRKDDLPRRHSTAAVSNELPDTVKFDPGKRTEITSFDVVKLWKSQTDGQTIIFEDEGAETADLPNGDITDAARTSDQEAIDKGENSADNETVESSNVTIVTTPDEVDGEQNKQQMGRSNSDVIHGSPKVESMRKEKSDNYLADKTAVNGGYENPVFTLGDDDDDDLVEHRTMEPQFHQPYKHRHHHHHHQHHNRELVDNTSL